MRVQGSHWTALGLVSDTKAEKARNASSIERIALYTQVQDDSKLVRRLVNATQAFVHA